MVYLLYILILFVLINLYFRLATRFNIVDKPCERSSHTRPVLRGGGIIFPLGILLWFLCTGFQHPWFFAGLMLISIISFIEDLSHLTLWIRLLAQIAAIVLLSVPLELSPFPWWVWMLALFITTGIINAFNFMDGINGITASYSLSVLIGLWIVNNYQVHFMGNDLLYAAALAVALFGFYNFRTHARCFAGDVGSVSISFILVFITGRLVLTSGNPFYLMFLCIYGVDPFLTIVYRLIRRENIFEAHRSHLYQMLANESGISHLKVSSGYAIVQLIINFIIIALINHLSYFYMLLVSIGIIMALSVGYIVIKSRSLKPGD